MFYDDIHIWKLQVKTDLEREAEIAGDLAIAALYASGSPQPFSHAVRFQRIEARLKAAATGIPLNRVRVFRAASKAVREEAAAARQELADFLAEISQLPGEEKQAATKSIKPVAST